MPYEIAMLYFYAANGFSFYSWPVDTGTYRISVFGQSGGEIEHVYLGKYADKYKVIDEFEKLTEKVREEEWSRYNELHGNGHICSRSK